MRLRLLAIAVPTLLAGCAAPEPNVYDIGIAEAYRRLAGSELDELRFARQCGILIHLRPQGTAGRSVTWRVVSGGREAYDGTIFYPRPAFNQPLRPAVEEQVAALLEGRAYDPARVPRGSDSVCNVQRAGLEAGHRPFTLTDEPGLAALIQGRPEPAEGQAQP